MANKLNDKDVEITIIVDNEIFTIEEKEDIFTIFPSPAPYALEGPPGPKGDTGPGTGEKGAPGTPGTQGDTGVSGPYGDKGDTGTTGLVGDKGDTGTSGDTGIRGDTGADSFVEGPKGDTGTQGDTGVTITDHSLLINLDFDHAGHTGFQKELVWDPDFKTYLISY